MRRCVERETQRGGVPPLSVLSVRLVALLAVSACDTHVYDVGRTFGTDVSTETDLEEDSNVETPTQLGEALPPRMPESSGSEVLFVAPEGGSDERGDGSASRPFETIKHALSLVALSGGIVEVIGDGVSVYSSSGGPYAIEWHRLGNPEDPVTLATQVPLGVTVKGPGTGEPRSVGAWIWGGASGFRVRGFRFSVTGMGSIGVQIDYGAHDIELDRIEVTGNGGHGVTWKGGVAGTDQETARVQMWGSVLHHNGADCDPGVLGGEYCTDGSHNAALGILAYADQSDSAGVAEGVVANCLFYGSIPGRHLQIGSQAHGFYIVNNTFFGNEGRATKGFDDSLYAGTAVQIFSEGAAYPSSDVVVKNNIMAENRGHALYGSTMVAMTNNLAEHNLAWNNGNQAGGDPEQDFSEAYEGISLFQVGPSGNLRGDPRFVDPDGRDFALQQESPALGAGDPDYTPKTDIDGRARENADIGAFSVVGVGMNR